MFPPLLKAHLSTLTVLSYENWTLKLNTLFFSFCSHFWPAFLCTLVNIDSSVTAPQITLFWRMLGVSPEARVLHLLIWCVEPQVLRPRANLRSPTLCSIWFSSLYHLMYNFTCNRNREKTMADPEVQYVQYEDMSRRIHCLACWRGLDASWSTIEVGLLVVCWDLLWIFKVKVSREIAQFSPCRTRTYATRNSGSNGPVS